MHGSLCHLLKPFESDGLDRHVAEDLGEEAFCVLLVFRADYSMPTVKTVELDELRNQLYMASKNEIRTSALHELPLPRSAKLWSSLRTS